MNIVAVKLMTPYASCVLYDPPAGFKMIYVQKKLMKLSNY